MAPLLGFSNRAAKSRELQERVAMLLQQVETNLKLVTTTSTERWIRAQQWWGGEGGQST